MLIRISIGSQTCEAMLADNATARAFAALLPLSISLEDYEATEKIAMLPRPLPTADAPEGITPATGDLAYYAPWGNLAIFYRDAPFATELVHIGRIDTGLDTVCRPGTALATFTLSG